jgi:hypothetical protein
MLAALDAAITREAETMLAASPPPPNPAPDLRLAIAGRMHAHADGTTAFFLFHYLRLLDDQTAARRAGLEPPVQTWVMPDWSPAPVSGSRVADTPDVGERGGADANAAAWREAMPLRQQDRALPAETS